MSAGSSEKTMFGDWWLDEFGDKPAHLRFILEMARYANKAGEVCVSVATIANRMGTNERHVWRYRGEAIKAGVLTEIGQSGRAKLYRLNYSNPGNSRQGNDRQGEPQTLAMDDANPGDEQQRPLAMAVVDNGIGTVINDRSIDPAFEDGGVKPAEVPDAEMRELALALRRYKPESEIASDLKLIPRQVGAANVARVSAVLRTDLSGIRSPIGWAVRSVQENRDTQKPKQNRLSVCSSGVCDSCGRDSAGFTMEGRLICLNCRESGHYQRAS